jgi:anaerobic ribonucleoside-triphosphate reductase activating protein
MLPNRPNFTTATRIFIKTMRVRIAGLSRESVTDGPGMRVTVFFQGCEHHCPGCHNPQTWDRNGGAEYELAEVFDMLRDNPMISGITLSGGEPFLQPEAALELAREFHAHGKNVWTYTGFLWDHLLKENDPLRMALLCECDVLVDGPFKQAERIPGLVFRGSANQRIIDVKSSLLQNQLIEWSL